MEEHTPRSPSKLVDEAEAHRLAEEHNLPPIEVDAALYGVPLEKAHSVLRWVEEEEGRLTKEYGLMNGRQLYRPVKMLRSWSKRHGTGRRS